MNMQVLSLAADCAMFMGLAYWQSRAQHEFLERNENKADGGRTNT